MASEQPDNDNRASAASSFYATETNLRQASPVWETPSEPVPGWPQVAALMATAPDYASFQKFSDVQTRSLLYYQAEITMLRRELKDEEWRDYRRGDIEGSNYHKRAGYLVSSERLHDSSSKQWIIMKNLRLVLKEYNEALLLFSQVNALEEPESHNLERFVSWLQSPDGGALKIGGTGEQNTWGDIYGEKPEKSLRSLFWKMMWNFVWPVPSGPTGLDLAVTSPKEKGGFSGWLKNSFIPFWVGCSSYLYDHGYHRRIIRGDEENLGSGFTPDQRRGIIGRMRRRHATVEETLTVYSQSTTVRSISLFFTLTACLLPTIAIAVLSQLHGTRDLLLCLAGFALVFAAGLLFLGSATRVEIFSATAAFSAVMVVFISVPIVTVPSNGVPYVPRS